MKQNCRIAYDAENLLMIVYVFAHIVEKPRNALVASALTKLLAVDEWKETI